jgi:hypothetical protein
MNRLSEGAEGRVAPPTLTPAEHMLNVCTIAAGLIVSPQNPIGTLEDTMLMYHKVIDAYMADPEMPR